MDKRTIFIIVAVGTVGVVVWCTMSSTVTTEIVKSAHSSPRDKVAAAQEKEAAKPESSESNPIAWVVVGLAVLGLGAYLMIQWQQASKPLPPSDDMAWNDPPVPTEGQTG